jgi:CheY-like chemotaxis protein
MKLSTDAVSTARSLAPVLADAVVTPADYTILVVDDQEETRVSTSLLLESEGYRVLTAATGAEALSKVQSGPVDLIIMDYLMPRLSGKQLIRELRKQNPNVQILLQTGYVAEGNVSEFVHPLNIQGYHSKIDGPDRLLLWVQALYRDVEHSRRLAQEQRSIMNLLIVIHEMRMHLHFILAHSQLLTDERLLLPNNLQQSIAALVHHQARLESLTTLPLLQSTGQSSLLANESAGVRITDYEHDVRSLVRNLLRDSSTQFVCEVNAQLAPIRIDPNKLLVIVHNLLEYVVTGSNKGKLRLSISGSPTGENLRIEIQATGIEHTAEAEAVIASFSQARGSLPLSTYSKITHGLAVACQLTLDLHGTLTLTTTAEAGATFAVTLPMARDSSEVGVAPVRP